jgi:hypothetical protein
MKPLVVTPEYFSLSSVFDAAIEQAQNGKGKARHATCEPFEQQQICQIPRYQGSVDFVTGQAIKKCLEINKLSSTDAKIHELYGALNYIAAAVIVLKEKSEGNSI